MVKKFYLHHIINLKQLHSVSLTSVKVREWVRKKRFCEEMSFSETASDIGVSQLALRLYLRMSARKGFPQWRKELRIEEAARLLSNLEEYVPVYVICGIVGIPDVRSFRRQFASVKGMTPLEYRRCCLRQAMSSSQRSGNASEGIRNP